MVKFLDQAHCVCKWNHLFPSCRLYLDFTAAKNTLVLFVGYSIQISTETRALICVQATQLCQRVGDGPIHHHDNTRPRGLKVFHGSSFCPDFFPPHWEKRSPHASKSQWDPGRGLPYTDSTSVFLPSPRTARDCVLNTGHSVQFEFRTSWKSRNEELNCRTVPQFASERRLWQLEF